MLVYSWSTFQHKVYKKQGQIQKSVNSTSVVDHGDHGDATDSSQSSALCNTP